MENNSGEERREEGITASQFQSSTEGVKAASHIKNINRWLLCYTHAYAHTHTHTR